MPSMNPKRPICECGAKINGLPSQSSMRIFHTVSYNEWSFKMRFHGSENMVSAPVPIQHAIRRCQLCARLAHNETENCDGQRPCNQCKARGLIAEECESCKGFKAKHGMTRERDGCKRGGGVRSKAAMVSDHVVTG